jgi:hypothetical protein
MAFAPFFFQELIGSPIRQKNQDDQDEAYDVGSLWSEKV